MNGFLHYFLSALDPMSNLGFSRAFPKLMTSALPSWWFEAVLPVALFVLPAVIVWLAYLAKPALVRPPLSPRPGQAEPLVSVVTAGRNEQATIGQCIRGALLCGYPNLEFIFVDDNSTDDSVAVARRAALSVTHRRHDTERVRIFPSPRRNGKASSLNIGIRMARGEFIVIHDADSIIQYGAIHHWLLPFADPRVGGVAANIRVDNSAVNLLTKMQEVEYAMKFTLAKFYQSKISLMDIISGMGGIFRADIIRGLGGFDTGLGDDRPRDQISSLAATNALATEHNQDPRQQTSRYVHARPLRIYECNHCDSTGLPITITRDAVDWINFGQLRAWTGWRP
jgi:cellulose synthase/poly-beta-1,6-N-acetylglucosamine synthase-like glycosyltransferase